jgi:hypothetical protein
MAAYIDFCRFLQNPERGALAGGVGMVTDPVVPFTVTGDP